MPLGILLDMHSQDTRINTCFRDVFIVHQRMVTHALCGTFALVHNLAQKGVFGAGHVSKGDMHKRAQIKTPLLV